MSDDSNTDYSDNEELLENSQQLVFKPQISRKRPLQTSGPEIAKKREPNPKIFHLELL